MWDKPLKRDDDAYLGINNTHSFATCLILYLYSLEAGRPPLYVELNRVLREMDLKYLNQLGPIEQALFEISQWVENNKQSDARIPTGDQFSQEPDNLSGCFLVYRGARMQEGEIEQFITNVGEDVNLKGHNLFSRSCQIALLQAFAPESSSRITIQNGD